MKFPHKRHVEDDGGDWFLTVLNICVKPLIQFSLFLLSFHFQHLLSF